MRIRFYALALPLALFATPALAMTWNVPGDFPTIQQAINASTSGDIVLVAPGTYTENLLIPAAQNGIKIHSSGGAGVTTIDGGAAGTTVEFDNVGITTEIIGFTITNGNSATGGGLALFNANPKVDSNIITGNVGQLGGGIFGDHTQSTISNNQITNNAASVAGGAGGGLYLDDASLAQVFNNTIDGNSTVGAGGGLLLRLNSNANVHDNTITNNSAGTNGGAFFITGATAPQIKNNVIRNNHADSGLGGGFDIASGAFPTITLNQIVSNTALNSAGIHVVSSSPGITQNNIQDNAAATGNAGGIGVTGVTANPTIQKNLIIRNFAGNNGGGLWVSGSTITATSNTIALNSGAVDGGGVFAIGNARVTLVRDIVSHSPVGNGVSQGDAGSVITVRCCDVWGNTVTNYNGMADPTGLANNFSADPFYCDIFSLDFHLFLSSPCTAANAPNCGLIGALDVGCMGPVRTQVKSWGSIKATYR